MFYLVTYATDPEKLQYINSKNIINLWKGKPWNSFLDKLYAVREFLSTLHDTDILCFTDAYDAILFPPDDPNEMETAFKEFHTDILFSAETNCFPWEHVTKFYPFTESPYKYLNSGGYVGTVKALKQIFSYEIDKSPCDQGYFTYIYINYLHDSAKKPDYTITLDTECKFFQTAYAVPWEHFQFQNGKFYNTVTKQSPYLLHFNGKQFMTKEAHSIIPIIYEFAQDKSNTIHTLHNYQKLHPVMHINEKLQTIKEYALTVAKNYTPPKESIINQDHVNHHAIFKGKSFLRTNPNPQDVIEQWDTDNRNIVQAFFKQINANTGLLDISLHDFVGDTNPHSVLGFSTYTTDHHNILIPDLYAMQNYKNAIQPDPLRTLHKKNKLHFIGNSTGTDNPDTNLRIQLCEFAKDKDWIEAYISNFVNIPPIKQIPYQHFLRPQMTIPEQYNYRHILIVDGNTACWDRLPWVMFSQCVPWKLESQHRCWYYEFLKPWVHYIPFTLQTLEETWHKVKDDTTLCLQIVKNANQFAKTYLTPEAHATYAATLLKAISPPLSYPKDQDTTDITWYCGEHTIPWEGDDNNLRGSEQAVVHLSQAWAAAHKQIRVYCNCTTRRVIHKVEYVPAQCFNPDLTYQTLILWRMPGTMPLLKNIPTAKRCIVDLHDNIPSFYEVLTKEKAIHALMFKSEFHQEEYQDIVPPHKRIPSHVIPNGVRLDLFKPNPSIHRNPYKFIYASCYSRGLCDILRRIWPVILHHEPQAELHLYYGLPPNETDHPIYKEFRDLFTRTYNVMDHGHQPVDIIYKAKCEATFHLYTTETRSETDCISIKESIAVGCIPILYDTLVFKERDGYKIMYDNAGKKIVELMRDPAKCDALREEFYQSKTLVSWEEVSGEWLKKIIGA